MRPLISLLFPTLIVTGVVWDKCMPWFLACTLNAKDAFTLLRKCLASAYDPQYRDPG